MVMRRQGQRLVPRKGQMRPEKQTKGSTSAKMDKMDKFAYQRAMERLMEQGLRQKIKERQAKKAGPKRGKL